MTVETEVNTDTKRMSVSFTRKLGDDNYGSTEVRTWFEQDIPEGATANDIAEGLTDMVNTAKVAVLDHLGVEVVVDETGVMREKHTPKTQSQAAGALKREFGGTDEGGAFDIRIMNQNDFPTTTVPPDIAAVCRKHGIDAVWANESKFGVFFKERVKQGDEPKLVGNDGKAAIIKPHM